MRPIEFYFLLEDHTWDTGFVDIPEDLLTGTDQENEFKAIEYVYKNEKLHSDVCMIGVYWWPDVEEEVDV